MYADYLLHEVTEKGPYIRDDLVSGCVYTIPKLPSFQ